MGKHIWRCTFLSTETYEKTYTCSKCAAEERIHLKSPATPAEDGCAETYVKRLMPKDGTVKN